LIIAQELKEEIGCYTRSNFDCRKNPAAEIEEDPNSASTNLLASVVRRNTMTI